MEKQIIDLTYKNDNKIRNATPEEIIENFTKEMKILQESGVEFSTVIVDSYNNIKEK